MKKNDIELAETYLASAKEVPDVYATSVALIAQTHATLALVEQQRIANLIALASLAGTDVSDDLAVVAEDALLAMTDTITGENMVGPDTYTITHPAVAAALGIEADR